LVKPRKSHKILSASLMEHNAQYAWYRAGWAAKVQARAISNA